MRGQRRDERGDTTDRDSSEEEEDPPVVREGPGTHAISPVSRGGEGRDSLALLVVEAGHEVDGREREEQQHGIEEDEATDDEPREICTGSSVTRRERWRVG